MFASGADLCPYPGKLLMFLGRKDKIRPPFNYGPKYFYVHAFVYLANLIIYSGHKISNGFPYKPFLVIWLQKKATAGNR